MKRFRCVYQVKLYGKSRVSEKEEKHTPISLSYKKHK